MTKEKRIGILWQFVAYFYALTIAIRVYEHFPFIDIWRLLMANVAATSVIFFFSYAFKNVSFYAPYWNLQPIVIGAYLISKEQVDVDITRQIIVFSIILIWSIRRIFNFFRNWLHVEHEDLRYVALRKQHPQWFPFVSYFRIMMLPTLVVYLGIVPLFDILKNNNLSFGIWDVFATIIGITGILYQWIADQQLFNFIKNRKDRFEVMNTGLWKYSRHPNYFGEICIWLSFVIFSIGAVGDLEWYNSIGIIGIILFFNFMSTRTKEKRLVLHKLNYAKEQVVRSKIFPWKLKNN